MSEWHPRVVRLTSENVRKHDNADKLSVADIDGFPVVFATTEFEVPGLAAYIPEDTVLPDGTVITSKKIRGIWSIGMLHPLPKGDWKEGDSVVKALGLKKREEADTKLSRDGEDESCPFDFPKYTDIESYNKYGYKNVSVEVNDGVHRYERVSRFKDMDVVVTEKIHGANARYVYKDGRLWVGSRERVKGKSPDSIWWKAAEYHKLEEKLKQLPNVVLFGEVYGGVQNLRYDLDREVRFRAFDMFDLTTGRYLDFQDFRERCVQLDIPMVPILYEGPWTPDIEKLCDGQSAIASHHREGFVIKPVVEQFDDRIGRLILKSIGNEYRQNKHKALTKENKLNQAKNEIKRLNSLLELYRKLADEARTFVERCERGEVRSVRTYNAFKTCLQAVDEFEQASRVQENEQ